MEGSGFRVQGLGFRVKSRVLVEFAVREGSRNAVEDPLEEDMVVTARRVMKRVVPVRQMSLGFGVWGLGLGVWGLGFEVHGLEFAADWAQDQA